MKSGTALVCILLLSTFARADFVERDALDNALNQVRSDPALVLGQLNIAELEDYAQSKPALYGDLLVVNWLQQAARVPSPSEELRHWVESKQSVSRAVNTFDSDHPNKTLLIADIGATARSALGVWLRRDLAEEMAIQWRRGQWHWQKVVSFSEEELDATQLWIASMHVGQARLLAQDLLRAPQVIANMGSAIPAQLALKSANEQLARTLIANYPDQHTLHMLRRVSQHFDIVRAADLLALAVKQDYFASVALNTLATEYGHHTGAQKVLMSALKADRTSWLAAAAVSRIENFADRQSVVASLPEKDTALKRYIRQLGGTEDAR